MTSGVPVGVVMRSDSGTVYGYDAYTNRILSLEPDEVSYLTDPKALSESATSEVDVRARFAAEGVYQPLDYRTSTGLGEVEMASVARTLESSVQSLVLEVTEQCSFRCSYCVFGGAHQGRRQHGTAMMSLTTAKKAVDYLMAHSQDVDREIGIAFYGGEPLLNLPVIRGTIDYVSEVLPASARCGFHLTTNGLALHDRDTMGFLAQHGISLTVSLDGPPDIHDAQRVTASGQATHGLVEDALLRLHDAYPDYYARCVGFNAVVVRTELETQVAEYFSASPLFLRSSRRLQIGVADAPPDLHDGSVPSGKDADPIATGIRSSTHAQHHVIELPRGMRGSPRTYVENRRETMKAGDGLDGAFELILGRIAQRPLGPAEANIYPRGSCVPGARKLFVSCDGTLGMCEKANQSLPLGHIADGTELSQVYGHLDEMFSSVGSRCKLCHAQRFCTLCPVGAIDPITKKRNSRLIRQTCDGIVHNFFVGLRIYVELAETNPGFIPYLEKMSIS